MYNPKALEHYHNPINVGEIKDKIVDLDRFSLFNESDIKNL